MCILNFRRKAEVYLNVEYKEPEALWSCRFIAGYDSTPAKKGYAYGLNHKNTKTSYAFHTYRSQNQHLVLNIQNTAVFFFSVFLCFTPKMSLNIEGMAQQQGILHF